MKVTFIGHASILVETRGIRILTDPWWRGPCFGAQWWGWPTPRADLVEPGVDFIYVSHGHHDHLHPGTLRTLDPRTRCLVSGRLDIAGTLRDLGFPVVEIGDDEPYDLGHGVRCRIMETHAADTLLAIEDGDRVLVNLNDALHAAPLDIQDRFIARLKDLYPRIDYVFCGYGVASHFPNCYEIPGKDRALTAARRQAHFNRMWARVIDGLAPSHAFPFAADVVFLEDDLDWVNEPSHNTERPVDVFSAAHPTSPTRVADIAPGFVIDGDRIVENVIRPKTVLEAVQRECADGVKRANAYGRVAPAVFEETLAMLRENVARCLPYLREHRGDWRFLVRFRNFDAAIEIVKRGDAIETIAVRNPGTGLGDYNVQYVTRLHYLRASLATQYGHEILFVGSGGIFRYTRAEDARRNLHRELAVVLVPHTSSPPSRFGAAGPRAWRLKKAVKRWLGRNAADLYDLDEWTVWQSRAGA